MRRPLIFLSLCFSLAFTVSAQQRVPVSASAPPAAVHPMPVASAASAAHVVPSHVANTGVAHPAAVNRVPPSAVKPVVPHRHTPNPVPYRPPGGVPIHTGSRNPGLHVGRDCNFGFKYPVQGLNGCAPSVAPVFGGAYFIPVPYYYGDAAAQEQEAGPAEEGQQVTSEEAPESAGQQSDQAQERMTTEPSRSAASNLNEALAQFVFVQRDGGKLYAVAYSFLNDKLQYVTKEGVRHSVGVDLLDLDATQKTNEQLGNRINLPNLPPSGDALNIPLPALR
jgi:hypothetical protein